MNQNSCVWGRVRGATGNSCVKTELWAGEGDEGSGPTAGPGHCRVVQTAFLEITSREEGPPVPATTAWGKLLCGPAQRKSVKPCTSIKPNFEESNRLELASTPSSLPAAGDTLCRGGECVESRDGQQVCAVTLGGGRGCCSCCVVPVL